MRNARLIVPLALAAAALVACSKQQPQANEQNISIDEGVPDNQVAANAQIETLPPDESSTTPSSQLQNGYDSPEVNDISANSQ